MGKHSLVHFEDRAVAFIDVLGFESLVVRAAEDGKSLDALSGLVAFLSSAVPNLDSRVEPSVPPRQVPKHTYISDCIILSAPLQDLDHKSYDGLSAVVMRVIQIAHYLLEAGYLLRGGITVGKVWHTESNIVGPAYQEAFRLEKECCDPVVRLSDAAIMRWGGGSRMCLRYGGRVFVNSLFEWYIGKKYQHGGIEHAYSNYAALVETRLTKLPSSRAKDKWKWFMEFLNAERSEGAKWPQA